MLTRGKRLAVLRQCRQWAAAAPAGGDHSTAGPGAHTPWSDEEETSSMPSTSYPPAMARPSYMPRSSWRQPCSCCGPQRTASSTHCTRSFASAAHPAEHAAQASPRLPGHPDPFSLVRDEIECVWERLRRCIVSDIPALERAAEYFFRAGAEGKRLRSTIAMLMASALAPAAVPALLLTVDDAPPSAHPPDMRRRQQRIAEISELIHVASLLHDDVIDGADQRRGLRALNTLVGNKVAILAGDFLLARASVSLASLRNGEVIMLMSQVLENLVAGEIMQLTATVEEASSMDHYLRKTFCKTASLMANSCKSVAVLAGAGQAEAAAAWEYGQHLGMAFQLVDDILDFTGTAEEMGKPAGSDLRAGLATAPVLLAAEQQPELGELVQRRFKGEGDVERALQLVEASDGMQRARALAAQHAGEAAAALARLPLAQSAAAEESLRALGEITQRVLTRRK